MLNQSTHSRVLYPTASKDFHGSSWWMTSVLNRPITLGKGVVTGVADAADRGLDACLRQSLGVANAHILRP